MGQVFVIPFRITTEEVNYSPGNIFLKGRSVRLRHGITQNESDDNTFHKSLFTRSSSTYKDESIGDCKPDTFN